MGWDRERWRWSLFLLSLCFVPFRWLLAYFFVVISVFCVFENKNKRLNAGGELRHQGGGGGGLWKSFQGYNIKKKRC